MPDHHPTQGPRRHWLSPPSAVRTSVEDLCDTIRDIRRQGETVGLCDPRTPTDVMEHMTSESTGSPPGRQWITSPPVGSAPARHHPGAATRRHDTPGHPLALRDRAALPRPASAPAGASRHDRTGQTAPTHARPDGGPRPEPDLCDDIVQQLFAVGLAMQITQRRSSDQPELADRITAHLNDLQNIIKQIRGAGIAAESVRDDNMTAPGARQRLLRRGQGWQGARFYSQPSASSAARRLSSSARRSMSVSTSVIPARRSSSRRRRSHPAAASAAP